MGKKYSNLEKGQNFPKMNSLKVCKSYKTKPLQRKHIPANQNFLTFYSNNIIIENLTYTRNKIKLKN